MKRLALVAVALLAVGTLANAAEPKMVGRASVTYVAPGNDDVADVDSAFGLGLGWELRRNERLGIDFGWWYTSHEVKDGGEKIDDASFMPLTVGANFHVTPDSNVDFYLGPFVGYAFFGDIKQDPIEVKADDAFIYGINLGFETPVADKGMAFYGSVKYVFADYEGDVEFRGNKVDTVKIELDPWVVQAGIAFRY